MLTLTDSITSWEDDHLASDQQSEWDDSITTEEHQPETSAWDECSKGLMRTRVESLSLDDPYDLPGHDSIATEEQQSEIPAWEECINALLKSYAKALALDDACDPHPNRTAIGAAIAWIAFLRKESPKSPPTYITQEPDGGIIVERRFQSSSGNDCLWQLTFYNDGRAERTDYVNGRIRQMISRPHRLVRWSIPQRP